jgi:hypothetical protein
LTALAEVFSREISAEELALRVEALADLGPAAIAAACRRAVRECESYPLPATLRRLAGEPAPQEAEDAEGRAAWEWFCRWLRRNGDKLRNEYTGRIVDYHELIERHVPQRVQRAVRRSGGFTRIWWGLCGDDSDLQWAKKEFLGEWRALGVQERAEAAGMLPAHPGAKGIAAMAAAALPSMPGGGQ